MVKKEDNNNLISNLDNETLLNQLEHLIQLYKEKKPSLQIDISIFSDNNMGILESLVKYLKENLKLQYSKIANLLNRDDRTIWNSYRNAVKKHPKKFEYFAGKYFVPLSLFADRKFGPLQGLVIYCKENLQINFHEISSLLGRDYQTVWLSYQNGIKKRGRINV